VHKKAVCEKCICQEHKTCVVRTYVDWLTDSDYDPPVCGICKGDIANDHVLRLVCLDLFHPECVDVYAASLPPHTAKAGYLCPTCSKPIFPPDQSNPLAIELHNHLHKASWASNLLIGKTPDTVTLQSLDNLISPANSSNSNNNNSIINNNITTDAIGIASRKPQPRDLATDLQATQYQDDDDKYKKRGIAQLLVALGLMKPSKPIKGTRQIRIRLNSRRLLIILALAACLVTVVILGFSLTTEDDGLQETKPGSPLPQ